VKAGPALASTNSAAAAAEAAASQPSTAPVQK
jgi:hypothetical protein